MIVYEIIGAVVILTLIILGALWISQNAKLKSGRKS